MNNRFGIDVETIHKATLMRALRRLKGTELVEDRGKYRECPEWSVVHYTGSMTEDQFDDWASKVKAGSGALGTFELM